MEFQPGMKISNFPYNRHCLFFKNKDGDFTSTFQMERWQIYQSHKMFTRIQKFHGTQKLRLDADKVKLFEKVRNCLAEIYEDEPDAFGLASVSKNRYEDLDDVNEFDLREHQVRQ